ncbi:unnamed protein product [Moneuplotes crassus]|uniref:Secreted protein n=1 Tax=Euplotes crassus TaxID=5936 RepID=A0AAD1Y101_EUPCR|nr:unnamed protein product [Moneuplotes crassus]
MGVQSCISIHPSCSKMSCEPRAFAMLCIILLSTTSDTSCSCCLSHSLCCSPEHDLRVHRVELCFDLCCCLLFLVLHPRRLRQVHILKNKIL